MRDVPQNIKCPCCQGRLHPLALGCISCGLKVEGVFSPNEFSMLDDDALHFLRIFIHCEGSIRDIEKALGVSYPTVKAKLARLREAVGSAAPAPVPSSGAGPPGTPAPKPTPRKSLSTMEVLRQVEAGTLNIDDALEVMQSAKDRKGSGHA